MMRTLLAISLIWLVMACAHKDAGKGFNKLSGRKTAVDMEKALPDDERSYFDSTFYVGYVDYFPETREFYTSLFYKEGHEYPDEDLLESKLDSVIIVDDDWGRERLPIEEARKILVLDGLDSLSIYNRRHELICTASLTRVEYLWNGLESYFIAVFESDTTDFEQTEELYGISASHKSFTTASFAEKEINDVGLNEFLIKKLKITRSVAWDMRHYRINPPGTIYSVISAYSMTSNEAYSYLTSMENNEVSILNEEVDNYHFLNILPVPVRINEKPLLLISAGYPSSDVIWDYLAEYDGTRYEMVDYSRVHLKNIAQP